MQQDDAYISAMKAFNEGDYENAYKFMRQSRYLSTEKRDGFLKSCLHTITEQYCYMIKEHIANGNYMMASGAKNTYINRYGENSKIMDIEIPDLGVNNDFEDSDDIEPTFWDKWKWWIVGICAILIVVAVFVFKNSTDEVDNKYMEPVEEVEVECVVEAVLDTLTYSGPYTLGREEGRAEYSYICIQGDTIYDGPFKFDEGGYFEDGTFGGGSSTVSVSGNFKNNVQDGEWLIGSGHMGASFCFKNGKLNGPMEWDSSSGGCYGEVRGTYKDGHLIGKFTYKSVEFDYERNEFINSMEGEFDSQGLPIGIWKQVVKNNISYYVMDQKSAESSGCQGYVITYKDGSTEMINAYLQLDNYLFDPSDYIFRDTQKLKKMTTVFPTYWVEDHGDH